MKALRLEDIVTIADSGTWGDEALPGEGDPVLRSTNIHDGKLDLTDPAYRIIPPKDRERRRLADGDIIVTASSGSPDLIGKCCLFRQPHDGRSYYFSNFTMRLRANESKADPRLVHYWLTSPQGRAAMDRMNNTTSGLRNLNKSLYLAQTIPLPPLAEQKRIAAVLDKADALRSKRRQALATLDTLLQSVFLDMFGDPVTNPKGWPVSTIGDVTDCLDSKRVPIKESDREARSGDVPYYGANGQVGWIDEAIYDEPLLLIAEDGGHFDEPEKGVAYTIRGPSWVNNHAHVLRPRHGKVELEFLHHHFRRFNLAPFVTGTTRGKLTQAQLNRIPVMVPPLADQKRFEDVIGRISAQVRMVEKAATAFDVLFASLQSAAFAGTLFDGEAAKPARRVIGV